MGKYGIQISQEGIPLERAADYQKVLDDKWPFIDIVIDRDITISKTDWPAVTAEWIYEIAEHNLGRTPPFTYRELGTNVINTNQYKMLATKDKIYLVGRWYTGDPTTPLNIRISLRVFSFDITEEKSYSGEHGTARVRTSARKYGAKVLSPKNVTTNFSSQEMSDYSLNSNAKALSLYKTGVQDINPWSRYNYASVSAVNTGTDTITFSGTNIPWTKTIGQAINYLPGDYATYPAPLVYGIYYLIPTSDTTCKLATTYANAINNVAINLTTAGYIPSQMRAMDDPSLPTDTIYHNIGYPPTYMFAMYYPDGYAFSVDQLKTVPVIEALDRVAAFVRATNTTLQIIGAQSQFAGYVAYAIIRDPAEVVG